MNSGRWLAPWQLLILCGAVGVGLGCAGSDEDGDDDCGETICPDDDGGTDSDTDTDTDADTDTDTGTLSTGPCTEGCIDKADPDIPPCTAANGVGRPCRDPRDCATGYRCFDEGQYGFPDGYCSIAGPIDEGGCDPESPSSCPVGSSCNYWGTDENDVAYYRCLKDCVIDDRNGWDESNCGCREGYECTLVDEVCMPGCTTASQDDDCCQYWTDDDGDFIVEAGEFDAVPNCTLTCNADSSRCVNPGDESASWGDSCLYDQDCPAESFCVRERDQDGDDTTPETVWPNGYCARLGCDLPGRECDVGAAGASEDCRNLGTDTDPDWICVKSCTVAPDGVGPDDINPVCGNDYSCFPDPLAIDDELNGWCGTERYNPGVSVDTLGGPCEENADCYSPYGQGFCVTERSGGGGFIGGVCLFGACEFPGMEGTCPETEFVCEPLGDLSYCMDRCDQPGKGFGPSFGCRDDYACYAAEGGGGFCYPACTNQPDPDQFCDDFFGGTPTCNEDTGICDP